MPFHCIFRGAKSRRHSNFRLPIFISWSWKFRGVRQACSSFRFSQIQALLPLETDPRELNMDTIFVTSQSLLFSLFYSNFHLFFFIILDQVLDWLTSSAPNPEIHQFKFVWVIKLYSKTLKRKKKVIHMLLTCQLIIRSSQ